ncbi:hypothetical protein VitviT2T_011668 [Vitis vinifera]|nr:hypothetical protein VitviT2T_011668 [Vitis vinifera]
MDEEFSQLQWARNLVRATGKDLLGSLQVVPWVKSCRSARQKVRDEFVGGSRDGGSVRESQPVDQNFGSKEKFEYGRRNRSVVGAAGRPTKGIVLDSDFLGLGSKTASCVEKKRQEVLGSSEWVQEKPKGGAGWVVGSNPSSLVDVGLAKGFMRPIGLKIKEAHPPFLFRRLFSPRTLPKTDMGAPGMEPMVLADEDFTVGGSFSS